MLNILNAKKMDCDHIASLTKDDVTARSFRFNPIWL